MLSIGIWQQLYIVITPTWLRYGGSGSLMWSQNDVITSRQRLTVTSNCFLHPYQTHTKCLSDLICCPWSYGSSLTWIPTVLGSDVGVLGRSCSQNVIIMSWLRLTATANCYLHPYQKYTKCLSTLICCQWVYSSSLTQIYPDYLAQILVQDHLWSQNVVITSWLRLTATSNCFQHPYQTQTNCLSTLICCLRRYSSSLTQSQPHCLAHILGFWVTYVDSKRCHYIMVDADSHLKLLPASILDINKMIEHIDMLSIDILSSSLTQFYPQY